jgi:phage shock protein PspC (stress-responsive transcriptional regulator)
MNKIITINLGGRAIQIEEDAYDALRDYLHQLQKQFANTENGREIIEDIEARISEMLAEKLKNGRVSINVADVKEVVKIMGKPSDFDEEAATNSEYEAQPKSEFQKRLYRDVDQRFLGGVCSGLAHYFNMDITIVRIIWLLMFFAFGTGFVIYIILWAVIPKANTTAEKLQMKGETPNIENIRKSVSDEAKKAMDSVNEFAKSQKVRSGISEIVGTFGKLFRAIFTVVAGILSVVFTIVILAIASYLLFGFGDININGASYAMSDLPQLYSSSSVFWLVKLMLYLLIILPIATLLIRLADFLFNQERVVPKRVYQALGIFWVLIVITSLFTFAFTAQEFKQVHNSYEEIALNDLGDSLNINTLQNKEGVLGVFDYRMVKIIVEPSVGNEKILRIRKSARGSNEEKASITTRKIQSNFETSKNEIKFSNRINLKGEVYRDQRVTYMLKLPVGTVVKFNPNMEKMLDHNTGLIDLFPSEAAGHSFTVTSEGLKCADCFESSISNGIKSNVGEFNIITVKGALSVKIRQSENESIIVNGSDQFKERLKREIENGELTLKIEGNWANHELLSNSKNEIIITTRDLKRLNSEGANKIEIKGLKTTMLQIEIEGVSALNLEDVDAENIKLDMEGGSKVNANGMCEKFSIDIEGVSSVDAYDLACKEVNINADGAGKCNVTANETINGEINGVVKVNYKGNPTVNINKNGAAKAEKVD